MSTKRIEYGKKELERDFGRLTCGRLIVSHRLSEDMSQKEFAKLLGITASSLCDLEKGRKIPSPGRAAKIARKLGLSIKLWVKVALQDQLIKEGLEEFTVSVA